MALIVTSDLIVFAFGLAGVVLALVAICRDQRLGSGWGVTLGRRR